MSQSHVTFDPQDSSSISSKGSSHPSQKQRRRKSNRVYKCQVNGCEKVYSRAEHLSRHQLNHGSKDIFKCQVPNCTRSFVRADLHDRHESRHVGEYSKMQNDNSSKRTTYSGSGRSSESMEYTGNGNLEFRSQSHLKSPYAANRAETNYQYGRPAVMQQTGAQNSSAFISPGREVMSSHEFGQNSNPSQHEQLPEIEIRPNEVSVQTPAGSYGGDNFSHSPYSVPDDLIRLIFNGSQTSNNTIIDDHSSHTSYLSYGTSQDQFYESPNPDIFSESYLPQLPLAISTTSYEPNLPSTTLSNDKSQIIFDFIRKRLTCNKQSPTMDQNSLFDGDRSLDSNIMSRTMMQEHINSYWKNFHSQLPILHRPTFSPNTTPNLLLIAIMIIGATLAVKPGDDHAMARSATEFSEVVAWYLRWEVFRGMHTQVDNLWFFQTLLLLETYEKTYSSRTLHERAHLHHATTIMLMRRGSFLAGNSPFDTPPNQEDGVNSTPFLQSPANIWWKKWIRREATRRVAFAAFMLDSTHAAMFGHSMIMTTHEMRLLLPCDDALWSAPNVAEVHKIESMLRLNGVTLIPFATGLQRALNGQQIHTNSFGRSILLCGLLSLSWHMTQREMQLASIQIPPPSSVTNHPSKWRTSISRAFDLWRTSYEFTIPGPDDNTTAMWTPDADALLGSRTALYHLAQLSGHADILECQVSAGAARVLSRVMRASEVEQARRRIQKVWAPTVEARKATFYALRFLTSVLCRSGEQPPYDREFLVHYATSTTTLPLHRWVLYCAALIVWCYSYAVDGPLQTPSSTSSSSGGLEEDVLGMTRFLRLTERIKDPEEVAFHRLNGCGAMLRVLCFMFSRGTWELLHEGAELLDGCVVLIEGGRSTEAGRYKRGSSRNGSA